MHLLTILVLGVASGTAAFTLTKTHITQRPRDWLGRQNKWLNKLVGCPYCVSHWLAAVACLIYQPRVTVLAVPERVAPGWVGETLDWGVAWLVVVFIAALTWGLIVRQIYALIPPH